jgi:integrase
VRVSGIHIEESKMSSLTITTRRTGSGPRYAVRYRLGGRAYPVVHAGTFKTLKDAKARRDLVGGELAAGRNPAGLLHAMLEPAKTRTFRTVPAEYRASRVNLAPATTRNIDSQLKTMTVFNDKDPATITFRDVQGWVAALDLKPSSVRPYLATLRLVLDYADCDPNPARDRRVELPRERTTVVEPPSAEEVDTIIRLASPRWRLGLRVLEQTGMRVGEVADLAWAYVDETRSRFRVKTGKTAAARRWVAVPGWLMAEVAVTCPRDDRTPERPVFPGFTVNGAWKAMTRACNAAGIAHYHPHDLRHRYASVKVAEGVPVTTLAAQLGHAKKSLTLDTYSHVLVDSDA